MSITFTRTGGSPITLIDGIERGQDKTMGPAEESGEATVQVQPRNPVRGAAAKPIARGGAANTINLSGVRLCATATAARQWLYAHVAACQAAGTGVLNLESGAVAHCTIVRVGYRRQGATVYVSYTCQGGAISAS